MWRKICALAMAVVMTLTIGGFEASAQQPSVLSAEEVKQVHKNMDEIGISQDVQSKLIAKLQRGEVLDSMKAGNLGMNIAADADVVTFPDGSAIKIESSEVEPTACGSGYCTYTRKVRIWEPLSTGSFYAKYTNVNKGYDYIDSVWGRSITSIGGTHKVNSFGINKKREDAGSWARASLNWTFTLYKSSAQQDYSLRFFVGNDTYSQNLVVN